ncbi:hypothetical protein CDAR_390811 [Caerostris darwini]|uniref:Uncharacterized protein n=1 Tax=Caerostris darwini TaxID=1538125 RepID=A0AAV4TE41_9ARAC|nr:hypothetical protein CDAR_390811 [Caerostris darwini]
MLSSVRNEKYGIRTSTPHVCENIHKQKRWLEGFHSVIEAVEAPAKLDHSKTRTSEYILNANTVIPMIGDSDAELIVSNSIQMRAAVCYLKSFPCSVRRGLLNFAYSCRYKCGGELIFMGKNFLLFL